VEVQVQQARSRIVRSNCIVRPAHYLTNPYINSYASEAAVKRITGKVGPGAKTVDEFLPPTDEAQGSANIYTTPGGGLTLSAYLRGPVVQTTLATVYNGPVQVPFPWQPRLPDDPDTKESVWGRPTVSSYQAQLGSLFFPQQPVTNAVEHYQNALFVMCKGIPDKETNCSVSLEDFLGGTGNQLLGRGFLAGGNGFDAKTITNPTAITAVGKWVAPYGCAIYGFLAEKSQLLNLSGLPISNARLLRHRFTFGTDPVGGTRTINCFTQFTRVMKVFLGGRVVVRE